MRHEKSRIFYHYRAVPDSARLTAQKNESFGRRQELSVVASKNVSFKREITFDKETSTFLVEYQGDDKMYPWKCNRKGKCIIHESKTKTSLPSENVFENLASKLEGVNDCVPQRKILKAVPFKNINQHSKLTNLLAIDEIIKCDRSLLKSKINQIEASQIVNPDPGDCYLIDTRSARQLRLPIHIDGLSWKKRYEKFWNEYSITSQYFYLYKNSVVIVAFSKEMHYNSSLKLLLVHYFGNAEISREETNHGNRIHGNIPFYPTSNFVKVRF